MGIFSFFNKPEKAPNGVKIFFHKESLYFNVTGTLLVSSKEHGLKRELVNYAIVEPTDCKYLNEVVANFLFYEATRQGFEVHGLVSFKDQVFGRDVPRRNLHKRLTACDEVHEYPLAILGYNSGVLQIPENLEIFTLYTNELFEDYAEAAITTAAVNNAFDFARTQSIVPVAYLSPSVLEVRDTYADLNQDELDIAYFNDLHARDKTLADEVGLNAAEEGVSLGVDNETIDQGIVKSGLRVVDAEVDIEGGNKKNPTMPHDLPDVFSNPREKGVVGQ